MGIVSASGANIADTMFRGTWNQAMGGNDFYAKIVNMALYGALFMLLLAIIMGIIIVNKK